MKTEVMFTDRGILSVAGRSAVYGCKVAFLNLSIPPDVSTAKNRMVLQIENALFPEMDRNKKNISNNRKRLLKT